MGNVLIVGMGGLGCPASLALVRGGVRAMTLVDPDEVEITNLHRQLWYRTADVGRPKVAIAAERLADSFPQLAISARQDRVDAANVDALFASHDLVIDGTDGVHTKFLLSDAAVRTGTPLVYGGVLRLEGQAMVIRRGGPCLRCLFETEPNGDELPTCAQAGVLGSAAGVVGGLQALLALRELEALAARAPAATPGESSLHVFDGARLAGRQVKVRKAADCICRDQRAVVEAVA
jgi:adenylyltransferase/sulfurtransferase